MSTGQPPVLLDARNTAARIAELANAATSAIHLATFNASPPCIRSHASALAALEALAAAPRRGVVCSAMLASHSRGSLAEEATNQAAAWLTQKGWLVTRWTKGSTWHSKFFVFDQRFVVIGSSNLTSAALSSNREANIMLESRDIASELIEGTW